MIVCFRNFADMKSAFMKVLMLAMLIIGLCGPMALADTVTISGRVTDYNGEPIDSCTVMVVNPDFNEAYTAVSDADGKYRLDNVSKGRYAAIAAMRENEYPRALAVDKKDMRLEFWAWNVVADHDINLDIRYEKMELYGTTAFREYGGRPELLIYTRPMSVTKVIEYGDFMDKSVMEKEAKVTIEPQYMTFEVYADGQPLKILSVQHLSLVNDNGNVNNDDCYMLQTSLPSQIYNPDRRAIEIRVVGHNSQYDESGESVYYWQPPVYDWKQ